VKHIVVLGSTGSVGRQTLDVVRAHPADFRVVGLSAGRNDALLAAQLDEFTPEAFVLADATAAERLFAAHPGARARCAGVGASAICDLARLDADIVVNALLGYSGMRPTLAALERGTDVALSNKETMVVAGALVRRAADAHGARILPVDSEHSAIAQCLRAGAPDEVARLVLTASGGPFRSFDRERLRRVTVQDALRHPTWSMGRKITVDSATLMNKGLEILEARWLFDIDFDRIDVVVHPQSIVHSLVEYRDGSVMAQLGSTDMRLPIWYALHAPERPPAGFAPLDLARIGALTFEPLDRERFPCVDLALGAGRRGGVVPAVLNAANEVAVQAFLDEQIRYLEIAEVIAATIDACADLGSDALDLDQLERADARARDQATRLVAERCATGGRTC
jgi:1-deoxy-D-xylulose-5-phosphate reductoisomerase